MIFNKILSSPVGRITLLCIAAFVIFVAIGLHGFSIGGWHDYIDGSKESEALIGGARSLRSDDWVLDLPIALSQLKNDFQIENHLIGFGEKVLAPFRTPAIHWITFFRPTVWGYFLGFDAGLSWLWWSLVFTNFLGLFLVLGKLFDLTNRQNILISLIYVFSPALNYWAFHTCEIFSMSLLAFYFSIRLLESNNLRWKAFFSLLVAYFTISAVLGHIYPPRAIPFFEVLIMALIGYLLKNRKTNRESLLFLGGAALLAGFFIFLFIWGYRDTIQIMEATNYPGRRFSTGGDFPFAALFGNWFFLPTISGMVTPLLGNRVEDSAFFYTFPVLELWILISYFKKGAKPHPVFWPLFILQIFFLLFLFWEFPNWLALITGLSRSASSRINFALGLIDLLILAVTLSMSEKLDNSKSTKTLVLAAWATILGLTTWKLSESLIHHNQLLILVVFAVIAFSVLGLWLLGKSSLKFLYALTALAFISSVGWNPLVLGGSKFIYSNSLAQKIGEIDLSQDHQSRWLVIGSRVLTNYPRIIGVQSIGGYHIYPDLALWKILDPDGKKWAIYNQMGFVDFEFGSQNEVQISRPGPGETLVKIPIDRGVLEKLKVTYLMVAGQAREGLAHRAEFELIQNFGWISLYKVVN